MQQNPWKLETIGLALGVRRARHRSHDGVGAASDGRRHRPAAARPPDRPGSARHGSGRARAPMTRPCRQHDAGNRG